MPVTQQIVRINSSDKVRYSNEVEALTDLLNFKSEPENHHLDMDWSMPVLKQAIQMLVDPDSAATFEALATEGGALLNVNHPVGPEDDAVYSRVTVFENRVLHSLMESLAEVGAEQVATIASGLDRNALSTDPVAARRYYSVYYSLFRDFLANAVQHRQDIVSWWD